MLFVRDQLENIFWSRGPCNLHNSSSTLLLWYKGSLRLYINELVELCSNKTLFTKQGVGQT